MRIALLLLLVPAIVIAEPLRVVTSVLPLKTFVEKIGGPHVEVQSLVRPGYNPHSYDPTPHQIAALSKAALFVRTGVPFEDAWMARIRAANPSMQVLDARSGIELRELEEHRHDLKEDSHGATGIDHADDHHAQVEDPEPRREHKADPHVWTDPTLVRAMAGAIRTSLSALDPAHAAVFDHNHATFTRELDRLDRDIHALLDPLQDRRFLVFHPAWGYFSERYGLLQVPIEREGKQPGARALAALIDQARREGIRVVFVQPQFDRRKASQAAAAIGGRVVAVDPLAPNYVDNLRRVAQEFAEALQQ